MRKALEGFDASALCEDAVCEFELLNRVAMLPSLFSVVRKIEVSAALALNASPDLGKR